LFSSPPTISNSHDQDDEDQQSNDCDDEEQHSNDGDDILDKKEEKNHEENGKYKIVEAVQVSKVFSPVEVIYQNRNVLNLADNIWHSGHFIQYTVLPDNNLSCFFQNRAQYWRLGSSSGSDTHDTLEKCSCCDFSYPSIYHQQLSQYGLHMAKNNAITDSLLTFLKNYYVDFNNTMPNSNDNSNINGKHINYNNNKNITGNKQRMCNNNAPYAAYQIVQQQQQQQYQNNGYHNNMNGLNQQINSFNNTGNGAGFNSNGVSSSLMNVMNQSRNVTSAFQQTMNNTSRYYNNNINNNSNNMNNGYGLYKQF